MTMHDAIPWHAGSSSRVKPGYNEAGMGPDIEAKLALPYAVTLWGQAKGKTRSDCCIASLLHTLA